MIDLIYTGSGNKQLSAIAIEEGWKYGSQPKYHPHTSLTFADHDFKRGNDIVYLNKYAAYIKENQPKYATAPDIMGEKSLSEILDWAELNLSSNVEAIIIIPKLCGIIKDIPDNLDGCPIILGYSVPSSYGGTGVPLWEFAQRPVHLLGGNPRAQLYLSAYLNVISMDNNAMAKLAIRIGKAWSDVDFDFTDKDSNRRYWDTFRVSCAAIRRAWLCVAL